MGSADRSPTARPCRPATVFDFRPPLARGRARRDGRARGDHYRDLGDAELPGGEHPGVARNQTAVLANQRRRRPAPLLDARRDRRDLRVGVCAGIFRVWDQPIDRPPLDLVGRPRSLISGRLSRAGARAETVQPAATITGILAMPSCRAASTLAWPAIRPPSSPTSAGVVQPHSLMLAAIAATCASECVRAFFAYGISRSIAHRSTLSAGHDL